MQAGNQRQLCLNLIKSTPTYIRKNRRELIMHIDAKIPKYSLRVFLIELMERALKGVD